MGVEPLALPIGVVARSPGHYPRTTLEVRGERNAIFLNKTPLAGLTGTTADHGVSGRFLVVPAGFHTRCMCVTIGYAYICLLGGHAFNIVSCLHLDTDIYYSLTAYGL